MESHSKWLALAGSVSLLLLSACGDGGGGSSPSTLTAADLSGVYDGTMTPPSRGGSGAPVGAVGQTSNEGIAITIFDRGATVISTQGTLESDGSVVLVGQQQSGNVLANVQGSATVREERGRRIVTGTLELEDGAHTFTLERPTNTKVSRFSGRYTFSFPDSPSECVCPSAASIELTFADDGGGIVQAAASDRDASGKELGSFEGGVAQLSPSGRLVIKNTYKELNAPSNIWLFGTLSRTGNSVTGSGEFTRQRPDVTGTWTATR